MQALCIQAPGCSEVQRRCRRSVEWGRSHVADFSGNVMRVLVRPLQRWVWLDTARRARKLLHFAETEADGGRDLVRAAEVTPDPVLRRLFLFHARDEKRHAELFRQRGT